MKNRSQKVYEHLCDSLKKVDIEKCYYLALMGMNRTLCLCSRFAKHDFLKELVTLKEFMLSNMKDIFKHNKEYLMYEDVCRMFDEISDNWDDYTYNHFEEMEEKALVSGAYEFMEAWYAFLGVINCSYEFCTQEKMIFFITLPIRYLDNYLANYCMNISEDDKLQQFVNEHKVMDKEVERVLLDVHFVLNCAHTEKIYERIVLYSELDIFEIGL